MLATDGNHCQHLKSKIDKVKMTIILAIFLIIAVAIILFCVQKVILIKKSIYYKYINKTKQLTSFDYLIDYDGNWLFKKVDFKKLAVEHNDSSLLLFERKIQNYQKIYIGLFIALLLVGIVVKILE